jgi:hypothetical protein
MDKLKILHMYPAMLDLYGDSGNVEILSYRCKMRGIETEVLKHDLGDKNTDFSGVDIVYLGGGADFEQQLLADDLLGLKDEIRKAYESGVYFLMICGGYQLMGQYYKDSNGKKIPGLGLFDYYTVASTNKRERCIGNIVVETELGDQKYKVIGFENHGGQTTNVTSPHGPLLSKNPKLADHIISYCMTRKTGSAYTPAPINDKLESECRKVLLERLLKK